MAGRRKGFVFRIFVIPEPDMTGFHGVFPTKDEAVEEAERLMRNHRPGFSKSNRYGDINPKAWIEEYNPRRGDVYPTGLRWTGKNGVWVKE